MHYYNQKHGMLDRLQMISWDDALIDTTEQGHVYGLYPVLFSFVNVVPHFLWRDKPIIALGNLYSHEIGISHGGQDSDDTTTGISFSPTGDAFHEARWLGVLVVAPLLWFLCFFGMDWLCGDTRRSPWGLLMLASCAHIAPEGMLDGPIHLITYGALAPRRGGPPCHLRPAAGRDADDRSPAARGAVARPASRGGDRTGRVSGSGGMGRSPIHWMQHE